MGRVSYGFFMQYYDEMVWMCENLMGDNYYRDINYGDLYILLIIF